MLIERIQHSHTYTLLESINGWVHILQQCICMLMHFFFNRKDNGLILVPIPLLMCHMCLLRLNLALLPVCILFNESRSERAWFVSKWSISVKGKSYPNTVFFIHYIEFVVVSTFEKFLYFKWNFCLFLMLSHQWCHFPDYILTDVMGIDFSSNND